MTGASPTTIRIRAWVDGTTEPTTWTYTGTDSVAALQAPGGVGLPGLPVVVHDQRPGPRHGRRPARGGLGGTGSNTPRSVDSVSISPSAPTTNQVLTATATAHDVDGGPVTLAYQWLRNDVAIAGATASTLNLAAPAMGTEATRSRSGVTANDGQATSSPVTSAAVVIANRRRGADRARPERDVAGPRSREPTIRQPRSGRRPASISSTSRLEERLGPRGRYI